MNPVNIPDDWEKRALTQLQDGADRVEGFVHIAGERYFRLMFPMKSSPGCVTCHHYLPAEGRVVVGGLSVTADKNPHDRFFSEAAHKINVGYISLWIMGLLGLAIFDLIGARLLRGIEFTATHDALTQLKNRREIDRLLASEYVRAGRYGNPLSVLLLDIDHFKKVNDIHGHQAGDEALRVVAQTIRQNIREIDIAGRYGGEEILIVAPGTTCESAEKLAQRINLAIRTASIKLDGGKSISVTASIGVSCYSSEIKSAESLEIKSAESLVKSADMAMYQAKESGRDRVCSC